MSSGFAFATDARLSDSACRVAQLLAMLARGSDRVTHSTETIAEKLGRSVRAVQLALKELVRFGYIRREWSNALNSRRALVLLWRGAGRLVQMALPFERAEATSPGPPTTVVAERKDCALTAQILALPPTPPYKDWETIRELHDDDSPAPTARPVEPAPALVESSSGMGSSPEGGRGPGPAPADEPETAAAVAKAEEVLGPGHEARARALSRQFGGTVVRRAIETAEPKVRSEGKAWGYVVGIVRNWAAEGMPPQPSAPADPRERRRSVMAEAMRIFRERRAGGDGR